MVRIAAAFMGFLSSHTHAEEHSAHSQETFVLSQTRVYCGGWNSGPCSMTQLSENLLWFCHPKKACVQLGGQDEGFGVRGITSTDWEYVTNLGCRASFKERPGDDITIE